ncbi:hypothetical protein CUROG_10010 [Corynebacterium urogenitale]|uniref:Antitoxin n=1 Tax=Corynebacterium urogenitale TaxID=2487892 RepID=A0A5J6ZCN9_9CORY|nr:hypothetical protein [Corynebacterium urogenitale]QFQ03337.1 hypothetical protein CUROG_10010 [Corynebacterium urogenitale]
MDLGNLGDKAKQAASEHSDKIKEQSDKLVDSKLDGDKADKAKQARDKGLDSLGN